MAISKAPSSPCSRRNGVWRGAAGAAAAHAIVDEKPAEQYLAPEFELFRQLFEGARHSAVIADPSEFVWDGERLLHGRPAGRSGLQPPHGFRSMNLPRSAALPGIRTRPSLRRIRVRMRSTPTSAILFARRRQLAG